MREDPLLDRSRGALLGLAVGDALGTTVEFEPPGSFEPVTDMTGGGPFRLAPGEWTDDTSMALCLAESIVDTRSFDLHDQLRRYVRWYREGYLSVNGECFDIGTTVRQSLEWFEATGDVYSGPSDEWSAGNGSIMRLAPVPIAWAFDPGEAMRLAGESSRTTHGAPACVDACRFMAGLIVGAIHGASKEELLSPGYTPVPGPWIGQRPDGDLHRIIRGDYLRREPPQIRGTGYVVASLEAALWAFSRSSSFREGALLAVNLGEDADTTGAVYGQIAGAYYGLSCIPRDWLQRLAMRDTILELADGLVSLSRKGASDP